MNTNRYSLPGALLCALLTLGATAQGQSADQDHDRTQIVALIDKYAESVSRADTGLAAEIWSTDEDVTFIHPKGCEHGWDQVRTNVYEKLMGAALTGRRLTIHDVAVHVSGEMAWAEFQWDFSATRRSDGAPVNTRGRETQIYRKTGRGWRIVHVHYSGVPVRPEGPGT